ncbi:hypothetical protein GALMADRAFT_240427 [Galerina marginata CBS 339.88]|uniref:Rhodopsin domain-containing protein n=1 Tax=Galerina marginata (strain CBS 339.88) TaxID=685588 RepID=A0A067TFP0_GALM3|nr:hypothetical protein GALMADRAFT_240427 [Galerina marginata CBS 339.88]
MALDRMNIELLVWRICLTLVHLFAIVSSFFRLYRHRKIDRIWWDDYFAAAAVALDIVFFPTLWLPELPAQTTENITGRVIVSQIVSSWIVNIAFTTLLWCSRISLVLSIARFMPSKTLLYKACIGLACLFFALSVALVCNNVFHCLHTRQTWTKTPPFQCPISFAYFITMLCFDFVADLLLVLIPVFAFSNRLKMPLMTRRLIQGSFAASILTAGANIVIIIVLSPASTDKSLGTTSSSLPTRFLPHLLVTVSVLVCNLFVILTSFYRLFRTDPTSTVAQPPCSTSDDSSLRRGTSCFVSEPASTGGDVTSSNSEPLSALTIPDSWHTSRQQPASSSSVHSGIPPVLISNSRTV